LEVNLSDTPHPKALENYEPVRQDISVLYRPTKGRTTRE